MTIPAKDTARFFETAIDDEIVLMNVDTGCFHSLKGPSVAIWNLIDGERSSDRIIGELIERYEVEPTVCKGDVTDFLSELKQAGFVISR